MKKLFALMAVCGFAGFLGCSADVETSEEVSPATTPGTEDPAGMSDPTMDPTMTDPGAVEDPATADPTTEDPAGTEDPAAADDPGAEDPAAAADPGAAE